MCEWGEERSLVRRRAPSGWPPPDAALVWHLKQSRVWSARLGACAVCTGVTVATLLQFLEPPRTQASCFSCICIPNKQEIVFICMQMCLSLRLGFWIKSFTVPLIPNYTPALTSPSPRDVGVFDMPSKRISVGLGCLVCHLRNRVRIWI